MLFTYSFFLSYSPFSAVAASPGCRTAKCICQSGKLLQTQSFSSDIQRKPAGADRALNLFFCIIQFLGIFQPIGHCFSSLVKRCANKPEHQLFILHLNRRLFVSFQADHGASHLWSWHKTVGRHICYNLRFRIILNGQRQRPVIL